MFDLECVGADAQLKAKEKGAHSREDEHLIFCSKMPEGSINTGSNALLMV